MSFSGAVRKSLYEWITFRGRSSRAEFWYFHLCFVIASIPLIGIVAFAVYYLSGGTDGGTFSMIVQGAGIVAMLLMLFLVIASVSVTIRRLHDRNLSGWWYAAFVAISAVQSLTVDFIPSTGFFGYFELGLAGLVLGGYLIGLILMVLPSTNGTNRFGPDPRKPIDLSVFA